MACAQAQAGKERRAPPGPKSPAGHCQVKSTVFAPPCGPASGTGMSLADLTAKPQNSSFRKLQHQVQTGVYKNINDCKLNLSARQTCNLGQKGSLQIFNKISNGKNLI